MHRSEDVEAVMTVSSRAPVRGHLIFLQVVSMAL